MMVFKDGEMVEGEICPICGEPLFYEMGFYDATDSTGGHTTKDVLLKVCNKCSFCEGVEE